MADWIWRALWLLVPAAWAAHHFAHNDTLAFFIACASLIDRKSVV